MSYIVVSLLSFAAGAFCYWKYSAKVIAAARAEIATLKAKL